MSVSIKLRQKAEQMLQSRYLARKAILDISVDKFKKKLRQQIITDLKLRPLIKRYRELKKEELNIEKQLLSVLDIVYMDDLLVLRDHMGHIRHPAPKILKKVQQKLKKSGLEQQLIQLENLKKKLLEELWLVDQPDRIRKILRKMSSGK